MSELIWAIIPLPEFEGKYSASYTGGLIRRNPYYKVDKGTKVLLPSKILANQKKKYYHIQLCGKNYLAHRLTAFAFLPNPNHWKEVNHKDGNKLNNDVPNLEWCNRSYNRQHAFDTGLQKAAPFIGKWNIGKKSALGTGSKIKHGEVIYKDIHEASLLTGLSEPAIYSHLNRVVKNSTFSYAGGRNFKKRNKI